MKKSEEILLLLLSELSRINRAKSRTKTILIRKTSPKMVELPTWNREIRENHAEHC